MAWTTPVDQATGFLVTAAVYNAQIIDNLAYLHGDAGTINLNALLVDTSGLTTGPLSGTFSGSQTAGINLGAGNIVAFGTVQFTGYKVGLTTDTQPRYQWDSNGLVTWGPGGSTAGDTTLSRAAAGILSAGGKVVEGAVSASQGGGTTFTPSLSSGLVQRCNQSTAGTLTIGSPGAPPTNTGALLCIILHNGTAGAVTWTWNAIFRNPPAAVGAGLGICTLWAWNPALSQWCLIFSAAE